MVLAARILRGDWPENHKFPADTDLCQEFDVSRTVIREALRLLGGKGLIEAVPRRGTHVAARQNWALWDKDVLQWLASMASDPQKYDLSSDALDMRLALEPTLAALAAARADDRANNALQDALRDMQQNGQQIGSRAAEMAYLQAFYRAAGNDFALAALPLADFALSCRTGDAPIDAYRRLTAAIAQKNGAAARQAALQAILTA